ncbi:asparagine synthetase [glutamine-hydrolyzing]-like [Liolophura sinensis]|uniref:asparagine synthetase [glutamine-hydrolyzing]-like n=1 Tax=Liolophura sinensis TaxID=3198878 RepID=UPI00315990B7
MCGIWAVFGSEEDVSVQCNACHKIGHRGPDCFRMESVNHFMNCCLGFHRLAIMDDLTGMQPMRVFSHPHVWLLYNGEIYNFRLLQRQFGFRYSTGCDGESIIHLYCHGGIEFAAQHLDGVFAFILLDTEKRKVFIGRDTFGIRPCFTLSTESGFLAICSEAKGLQELELKTISSGYKILPFPPGHVDTYQLLANGKTAFEERTRFHKIGQTPLYKTVVSAKGDKTNLENIADLLEAAVRKRLLSERRIGCLLSGGLDSSLVAALLVKNAREAGISYPIQTFSIGMEGSPDLIAAKKVASYLGTEHHEVVMTPEDGLNAIEKVIYHLESYDITTVRASVGMYLVSKYIKEKTDTVVIYSGEGSDELAQGYIYFHKSPSPEDGDAESRRLLEDLYYFDVLRGDKSTAAWGLEIRVPFLDHLFTSYYLSLPAEDRQPKNGIEKYLLRSAFAKKGLIPNEILWRPKEAFSDGLSATSKPWYEMIQNHLQQQVNEEDLGNAANKFPVNPPKTKEAFYYRTVFEKHYPGASNFTPYFWMPRWIEASDPSARTLKHYKQ